MCRAWFPGYQVRHQISRHHSRNCFPSPLLCLPRTYVYFMVTAEWHYYCNQFYLLVGLLEKVSWELSDRARGKCAHAPGIYQE